MRHNLKELWQWILAALIGFILINCLCFFYEHPVGWIDTPYGPSLAVRRPGSFLVHGTEGYSFTTIDRNGYTNPDKALSDPYLLIMGSSHTQGKEVAPDRKYSVLVSDGLSGGDGLLHAYNIACDGHFLPSILRHFPYAVEAYPDAAAVIIEISSTDAVPWQLTLGLSAADHPAGPSASDLFDQLTLSEKIKQQYVKELLPFLSLVKTKLAAKAAASEKNQVPGTYDPLEYGQALNAALEACRACWSKPIVFVYHPGTWLEPDGSLTLIYNETWELFSRICAENQIDLIDMGEAFARKYEEDRVLPYGFSNSTPGSGHLNRVGHQLLANEILDYWEGLQK